MYRLHTGTAGNEGANGQSSRSFQPVNQGPVSTPTKDSPSSKLKIKFVTPVHASQSEQSPAIKKERASSTVSPVSTRQSTSSQFRDGNEVDSDHNENTPRSLDPFKLGPCFTDTYQNFEICGPSGQPLYAVLSARFDRGFQLTANDNWLSYRRNYFTLTTCFSLIERDNRQYGKVPPFATYMNSDGVHSRILSYSIRITALRMCKSGEMVELPLIQHTPKRDKGPREAPAIVPTVPGLLPDPQFMRENTHYRSSARIQKVEPFFFRSKSLLGSFCEFYPEEKAAQVAVFDRVQFTTAGGGGSQVCKAIVQLVVTLEDDISYVLAYTESDPFTLRNRSPGNYFEDGTLIPRARKSLMNELGESPNGDGRQRRSLVKDEHGLVVDNSQNIDSEHRPTETDLNLLLISKVRTATEQYKHEYREISESSEDDDDPEEISQAFYKSQPGTVGMTESRKLEESPPKRFYHGDGRNMKKRTRPRASPGDHLIAQHQRAHPGDGARILVFTSNPIPSAPHQVFQKNNAMQMFRNIAPAPTKGDATPTQTEATGEPEDMHSAATAGASDGHSVDPQAAADEATPPKKKSRRGWPKGKPRKSLTSSATKPSGGESSFDGSTLVTPETPGGADSELQGSPTQKRKYKPGRRASKKREYKTPQTVESSSDEEDDSVGQVVFKLEDPQS